MSELLKTSPTQAAALILCGLALLGFVAGLVSGPRGDARPALMAFVSLFLGSAALVLGGEVGYLLLVASAPYAWMAVKAVPRSDEAEGCDVPRAVRRLVMATLAGAIVTLALYRLGDYSPMALTWESPVIEDLITELDAGRPLSESFAQRLKWNHGVLSGGANSLVFGFPALLTLKFLSADFVSLRLPAALAFLGACIAIFAVTRRTLGWVAAASALAFFGLNQVILIYARYGSSAAGSLCALACALLVCVCLIQRQRIVLAPLAAVCLYVATLGYSPARVPVVIVVIMTVFGIWSRRHFTAKRRAAVAVAFLSALLPIVLFQVVSHTTHFYVAARGEQFFGMLISKYWPDEIRALQTVALATKPLMPGEVLGIAVELIRQITWPQLWTLLDPLSPELRKAADPMLPPFHDDPLFLKVIAPALTPFFILGLAAAVRHRHYWLFSLCVMWIASSFGAVLLSNRVDDHRLVFVIIPLSIFAALGVSALVRCWQVARCPRAPLVLAVLLLLVVAVVPRARDMYDEAPPKSLAISGLRRLLAELPSKNLVLVTDIFHRELAALRLDVWNDKSSSRTQVHSLNPELREVLDRGTLLYRQNDARQVAEQVEQGKTIILHPASRYLKAASVLSKQGVFAYSYTADEREFLVIDAGKEPPSAKLQRAILPEISEAPKVSLVLPTASGVPLSSLVPLKEVHGFGEMRLNRTWGGGSIVIGGESYRSGLGFHAPTTLRYAVPSGATAFQAIVAVDDDTSTCARGSFRLTLRDEKGRVVYQSGVITQEAPKAVIVELPGVKELELDFDDAGDGRDCDHVDLADALFALPPGSTASCVCPKAICERK